MELIKIKYLSWASLVAQLVKNLPAIQETWVQSLGWEDPLEKGKATTPVFWPGEFHGLYSPWGCKELDMTGHTLLYKYLAQHLPQQTISSKTPAFTIPSLNSKTWPEVRSFNSPGKINKKCEIHNFVIVAISQKTKETMQKTLTQNIILFNK